MFWQKRTDKASNRDLVEKEVQKLVDAGLVCRYDGDHLRLTEYGMRVAEQLREEERSAVKARRRPGRPYNHMRRQWL